MKLDIRLKSKYLLIITQLCQSLWIYIKYEGWSNTCDQWVLQHASKNTNVLITKNKCKKWKEIRKKTKSKIANKKIKHQNKNNNNDKLFHSMSNDALFFINSMFCFVHGNILSCNTHWLDVLLHPSYLI